MLSDIELQNFLHDWLTGVTGLDPHNVIPKWQAEPPNIAGVTADWMAFGITNKKTEGYPYIQHFPSSAAFPNGYDQLKRNEILTCFCHVYGPNADNTSTILRDGVFIPQNTEQLWLNDMGLVHNGDIITLPELIKDKWIYRNVLQITIRRKITLQYAVENILTAGVGIYTDTLNKDGTYYHETFTN